MKEYKYKINGNLYKVSVGEIEKNIAHVEVNGTVYNVEMEEAAPVKVSAPKPSSAPRTATGEPVISKPTSVSSGADAVKSPLPGVVNDILVNVGDTVNVGQTVLILEAMKKSISSSSFTRWSFCFILRIASLVSSPGIIISVVTPDSNLETSLSSSP